MTSAQLETTIDSTLIGLASVLGALMLWVVVRAVMRGRVAGIRCQHCGYERGAALRCSECGLTVAEARPKEVWRAARRSMMLAIGAVVLFTPVAIKKWNKRSGIEGLVPSFVWLAISSPRESGVASSVAAARIRAGDAWEWQVDRWLRLDVPADPEALRKGVMLSLREGERPGEVWAELTGQLSLLESPAVSALAPVRIRARPMRAALPATVSPNVYVRDTEIFWPLSEGFERVAGNHEARGEWIIERAFDFGDRRVLIDAITIKAPVVKWRENGAQESDEVEKVIRETLSIVYSPRVDQARFGIYANGTDPAPLAIGIEVIVRLDGVEVARVRAVKREWFAPTQRWRFTVIDEHVSPEWREAIMAMPEPGELEDRYSVEVVGVPELAGAALTRTGATWKGHVEMPRGRLRVNRSSELPNWYFK